MKTVFKLTKSVKLKSYGNAIARDSNYVLFGDLGLTFLDRPCIMLDLY